MKRWRPPWRRRLRRSGLHLLIRLPAAPDIWRMLIARALYRGSERRVDPRVAVGSPVAIDAEIPATSTLLIDISNRGCRLQTSESLRVGDPVEFTIPVDGEAWCEHGPLTLRGRVRRRGLRLRQRRSARVELLQRGAAAAWSCCSGELLRYMNT